MTYTITVLAATFMQQQQQPLYGTVIQDNPGKLVPESIGHITILLSTSNQSFSFTMNQRIFLT